VSDVQDLGGIKEQMESRTGVMVIPWLFRAASTLFICCNLNRSLRIQTTAENGHMVLVSSRYAPVIGRLVRELKIA